MRILLVEDDHMIGESVFESLKDSGYAPDWVKDGESALTAIACQQYDLMLLDIGLPKRDGISVLQKIRQGTSLLPVIILTARDGLEDRILGLDAGADDYLIKPFALGELNARIRAVLRRQGASAGYYLTNGSISLDPATREAFVINGEPIRLSAREFALLRALLARPGAILSRSELEEKIYNWGSEVESNAVEFLIHSLRKKFGSTIIKNIRGLGWMVDKTHS
ncbi:MAG: response regulator transcription factor [Gammaproteobacteria bacterium]|nr:MAG: response regulator transcription factor [Gammaproteobacteria bacterium]